jgi:hypothetical protein
MDADGRLMGRAFTPREHKLQAQVAAYLRLILPPEIFATAIDHANKASGLTGAILKARGAVAGLPDHWLIHAGRVYCIELKRKGGVLSADQIMCHLLLRRAGAEVAVCRELADVEEALMTWKIPLRGRIGA